MGKTLKYVKEFDFGPPKVHVQGYCRGGAVKKAAPAAYAKGGAVKENATGEAYPSRAAMVKHERTETPRMQREEIVQRAKVVAPPPARRGVPVAAREPMIPMAGARKAAKS